LLLLSNSLGGKGGCVKSLSSLDYHLD
jgi:hypothetical protein